VSRKVSLKAVKRNRIKRGIRESFRHNKRQLSGLDIVVIARPAAASADPKSLQSSINKHWQKISDHA
jgi:ribonuclease P protein component